MLLANETVAAGLLTGRNYRLYTVPMRTRIRRRSRSWQRLSIISAIPSISDRMRYIRRNCRSCWLRIDGTPEEALISRLTLRSMKQAKYTPVNTGHFGLATHYYCHFTSPIRRYPDLQIHRIIKDNLRGRMNEKRIEHYQKILPEVAKHSSEMERRADEAEREMRSS